MSGLVFTSTLIYLHAILKGDDVDVVDDDDDDDYYICSSQRNISSLGEGL
jgi:hypothetical protein